MSHVVKLRVNGADYAGFQGGEIRLGIDQICSSFSLDYFDGHGATPIEWGDRCQLLIDDALVMDGYADDVDTDYDARSYKTTISGRSTTGDLVDCAAGVRPAGPPKTSWKNSPISAIVADILNPFALQARIVGDPGANFAKFRLQKGELCADAITRMIRSRGFVAYTEGSDLVIARAGATSTATVIRRGDQVTRGSNRSSGAQRFSHYIFKGQTRANDTVNGVNAAQLDGRVEDQSVERWRPMIVVKGGQDSRADHGQLAVLERNQRAGRGERLTYTVVGWENQEGLWKPNVRCRVVDDWANVDCEMLVANVTFRLTKGGDSSPGYVTEIELTRPEAYDVIDYPRRVRRRGVRDSLATTPIPVTPLGLTDFALSSVNAVYGRYADQAAVVSERDAEVQRTYGGGR